MSENDCALFTFVPRNRSCLQLRTEQLHIADFVKTKSYLTSQNTRLWPDQTPSCGQVSTDVRSPSSPRYEQIFPYIFGSFVINTILKFN